MLLDYFQRGGLIMWPILGASVVALGVVMDRLAFLLRTSGDLSTLTRDVFQSVDRGALAEASERCRRSPHPVAIVIEAGLAAWDQPRAELERRLERAAADELDRAETRLPLLANMVAILPMLGFLGTIFGLINAFSAWAQAGAGVSIEQLAGGISQAMITTAAGLATSIPYVVAYNALSSRAAALAKTLNAAASDLLGRHPSSKDSAGAAALPLERLGPRNHDRDFVEERAA